MDIKLFSLCKQEVPETEKGKRCIYACVKSLFPESDGFYAYSSQKRMLLAISQSLRAADIVVVAVQNSLYHATKKLLCSALDVELEDNDAIAEKLIGKLGSGEINQATFDANIMFPVDGEIMPTDSGLNSGFAITSGGQHIVYLPIDAPWTEETVYGSLYDYLAPLSEIDTDEAMKIRHVGIVERTLEKFSEQSIKAAVYNDDRSNYFINDIDGHMLKNTLVLDNQFPERENQELDDYCVYTARDLRDRHNANYGIVFSKPCVDEAGERFIAVAVADENGTNVIRVFAEPDESDRDLFAVAVDKIMLMLYNYNEMTNIGSDESLSAADKRLKKAAACLTAVTVGASAVIGVVCSLLIK